MIFIVVKFRVEPEYADGWLELVGPFTRAVREEPGNLWFEWSVGIDDPLEFVLLEAFRDQDAGAAHVRSDHFAQAMKDMLPALSETPRIISQDLSSTGWDEMGELRVGQR